MSAPSPAIHFHPYANIGGKACCGHDGGGITADVKQVTCAWCRATETFITHQHATSGLVVHFAVDNDRFPACLVSREDVGDEGVFAVNSPGLVTCFACRKTEVFKSAALLQPLRLSEVMAQSPVFQALTRGVGGTTPIIHYTTGGRGLVNYRCGATPFTVGQGGSSVIEDVTCTDCLYLLGRLRDQPKRSSPPAYMNENDDGVFTFHDVHIMNEEMEVLPSTTGNVEITIKDTSGEYLFTLSHLDRANLVRALLHDFHYSPETGGPND